MCLNVKPVVFFFLPKGANNLGAEGILWIGGERGNPQKEFHCVNI